jgi:hypothetical protein
MVRAILDGSKTMTRRVVKLPADIIPEMTMVDPGGTIFGEGPYVKAWHNSDGEKIMYPRIYCPYGQPGDRLWVRETWGIHTCIDAAYQCDRCEVGKGLMFYRTDHADAESAAAYGIPISRWRPSIHMPRWASRITLEIIGVKVERVNDISGPDVVAEGIPSGNFVEFMNLWDSINAKRGYGSEVNPWVWAISFKGGKP